MSVAELNSKSIIVFEESKSIVVKDDAAMDKAVKLAGEWSKSVAELTTLSNSAGNIAELQKLTRIKLRFKNAVNYSDKQVRIYMEGKKGDEAKKERVKEASDKRRKLLDTRAKGVVSSHAERAEKVQKLEDSFNVKLPVPPPPKKKGRPFSKKKDGIQTVR